MQLNTKSLVDVEIGQPLFADGIYHCTVFKAEVKPNKARDGQNLEVTIQPAEPVIVTKDGKELPNKGRFKLTRRISLKPTDSYDPNTMIKELAVAVGHDVTKDFMVEDLQGKRLMVNIVVRPAEGAYPESNDIRRFSPVKEDDTFDWPALG